MSQVKSKFVKCVFADNQYNDCKDNVKIGNRDYKMLFQREITGNPNDLVNTLCVNCFQFTNDEESINYMLFLGYAKGHGTYCFSFSKSIADVLIDMDNIIGKQEDLPNIKESFHEYYGHSIMTGPATESFDDMKDTLYALFDYCYSYLVENKFHPAEIQSK